ncbi:MAG: zinc ribbon domain-containing protein [Gammaproteobacteria bacterium]|nr:zinc ribbon domain-containing protein [Gammaproteobacteria bacterium]
MYRICPKCGHQRDAADPGAPDRCPACGIIYAKWLKRQLAVATPAPAAAGGGVDVAAGVLGARLRELFLHVPERVNPIEFWARVAVFVGLLAWGWHFIAVDIETLGLEPGFLHRVNLPFHETGHLIFRPFGRVMMYLGGSLAQVLMPLIVLGVFLLKYRNTFAAAVALWWTAQSLMDVAPYIADATAMELTLLGGKSGWEAPGRHDWQQILGEFNRLEWDKPLAAAVDNVAIALMLAAFAWGALVLWRQWRNLDRR